jgi:tripeptidyl-peptidase-1
VSCNRLFDLTDGLDLDLIESRAWRKHALWSMKLLWSTHVLPLFWLVGAAAHPHDWAPTTLPATHAIPFTVALRPSNRGEVDRLVHEISDPHGKSYGQYLSRAQVKALTATNPVTVSRVQQALAPALCVNKGDWLRCEACGLDELGLIFGTTFVALRHEAGAARVAVVATGNLVVPALARPDVVFVTGLARLPDNVSRLAKAARASAAATSGGAGPSRWTVVPDTIRLMYNVSVAAPPSMTVVQAAAIAQGYHFERQSDLSAFGRAVGMPNLTIHEVDGDKNTAVDANNTEAPLDIQMLASSGLGNTNVIWNWGGNDGAYDGWIFALANSLADASDAQRPSVVSSSFAWPEEFQCGGEGGPTGNVTHADCAGADSRTYMDRTNAALQKLALLGTTLLVSSGDSGAHGRLDALCTRRAPWYPSLFPNSPPPSERMRPNYPASSPFVTSVGGTMLAGHVDTAGVTAPICGALPHGAPPCAGSAAREVVATTSGIFPNVTGASAITSGGGFSNASAAPAYQRAAVAAYLANRSGAVPDTALFNSTGRAYPDISAVAAGYYMHMNGRDKFQVDGTSASTPVIAGLVARINAHRAARGRPAVGFLNPLLYRVFAEAPRAFNDITQGNNRCTEWGCSCQYGFGAAKGWDAATGLGSPNFGRLLEAIDKIDDAREALTQNRS